MQSKLTMQIIQTGLKTLHSAKDLVRTVYLRWSYFFGRTPDPDYYRDGVGPFATRRSSICLTLLVYAAFSLLSLTRSAGKKIEHFHRKYSNQGSFYNNVTPSGFVCSFSIVSVDGKFLGIKSSTERDRR